MTTDTLDSLDGFDFGDFGGGGLDLDLGSFDIGDEGERRVQTRYIKPPLYVGARRGPVLYDRAVDLVRETAEAILAGERVDAIVSGNFIFGDFLEAFAVETNSYVDDLTLSTLSVSKDNVDSLHNLMAGDYLGALGIIVSDYWYSHNRVNVQYIYDQLDISDRFQLAVAGTHTKITLMRIGDRKIVMHGSANLRSSRSVENFTIETSAEAYDFHFAWHRSLLENYATIRKSVRATELFDTLKGVTS